MYGEFAAHTVRSGLVVPGYCVLEAEVKSLEEVNRVMAVFTIEFPEFKSMPRWLINYPSAKTPNGFIDSDNV